MLPALAALSAGGRGVARAPGAAAALLRAAAASGVAARSSGQGAVSGWRVRVCTCVQAHVHVWGGRVGAAAAACEAAMWSGALRQQIAAARSARPTVHCCGMTMARRRRCPALIHVIVAERLAPPTGVRSALFLAPPRADGGVMQAVDDDDDDEGRDIRPRAAAASDRRPPCDHQPSLASTPFLPGHVQRRAAGGGAAAHERH